MYEEIIASCACADASNFERKDVKIFLLNLWSVCEKLVKKFQANLKIWTKCRTNFHKVENLHELECTRVMMELIAGFFLFGKGFNSNNWKYLTIVAYYFLK